MSRQNASEMAETPVSTVMSVTKMPDVPQQAAATTTSKEPVRSERGGAAASWVRGLRHAQWLSGSSIDSM